MTKTKYISKKLIALIALVLILATAALIAIPLISSAAGWDALRSNTSGVPEDVDVYLIAGQSNAVGYGGYTDADIASGGELYEAKSGYSDVYFWSSSEPVSSPDNIKFRETTLDMGSRGAGAEIGIAEAVKGSGRKTIIIKVAVGATYLYPRTKDWPSTAWGTWTSPSFVEELKAGNDAYYNQETINQGFGSSDWVNLDATTTAAAVTYSGNTSVTKSKKSVGHMYYLFLQNVKSAVAALEAQGYSANLRGLWWMQGEAETGGIPWEEVYTAEGVKQTADFASGDTKATNSYGKALECLVNDLRGEFSRSDFGFANAADNADMPFVLGRVRCNQDNYNNPDGTYDYNETTGLPVTEQLPAYMAAIQRAQDNFADRSDMDNIGIVDIENYELVGNCTPDKWHFNAKAQKWLGEQFVAQVKLLDTAPSAGKVLTKYGEIPAADAGKNFAVFYQEKDAQGNWGAFKYLGASDNLAQDPGTADSAINFAYEKLKGAGLVTSAEALAALSEKHAVILTMKSCTISNGTYANMAFMLDKMTLDLNGKVVTSTANYGFIHFQHKWQTWVQYVGDRYLDVDIINGSIIMNPADTKYTPYLLWFDAYKSSGTYKDIAAHCFNINVNNVKYTTANGTSLFGFFDSAGGADMKVRANVSLNNCDFTLNTANACGFNAYDTATGDGKVNAILNVSVNGGYLRMPEVTNVTVNNIVKTNNGSTVKVYTEKDASGNPIPQFKLMTMQDNTPEITWKDGIFTATAASVSAYSASGVKTFGKLSFYSSGDDGNVFALRSLQKTKYGTAPAFYIYNNGTKYPILLFKAPKAGGSSVLTLATKEWMSGNGPATIFYNLQSSSDNTMKDPKVLFTADYNVGQNILFQNICYSYSDIVVDFGGHQMNLTAGALADGAAANTNNAMFAFYQKANISINYTIKNGTVNLNTSAPFISFFNSVNNTAYNPENVGAITGTGYNVSCEDIVFKAGSYTSGLEAVAVSKSSNPTWTNTYGKAALAFNNCEFNFNNFNFYEGTSGNTQVTSSGAKEISLYKSYDLPREASTATYFHVDVKVNGGKIVTPTREYNPFTFITKGTADTTSTVTIGKYDGKMPELYLRSTEPTPTFKINSSTGLLSDSGDMGMICVGTGYSMHSSSDRKHNLYIFNVLKDTAYGSVAEYYYYNNPFLVFSGGVHVGSAGDLKEAFTVVSNSANTHGTDTFILLTRDHSDASGTYDNITSIAANVVIDLGGHTLTDGRTGEALMFNACAKAKAYDRYFTVRNGAILLKNGNSAGLIDASAYASSSNNGYNEITDNTTFYYIFDGVNIKYDRVTPAVVRYIDNNALCAFSAPGREMILDVSFNNCTFDLSSADDGILFNAKDPVVTSSAGYVDGQISECVVKITVNGGTIKAKTAEQIASLTEYDSTIAAKNLQGQNVASSVVFTNTAGAYATLTVPAGTDVAAAALALEVITLDTDPMKSEYFFTKSGSADGVDTYIIALSESEFTKLNPRMNLILEAELGVNIYIPKASTLNYFTVNGRKYNPATDSLTEESLSGVGVCYKVTFPLAAFEAAREFEISVNATHGGVTKSASWTQSIIKYSEDILAMSDSNPIIAAAKPLIRDMLNYIRAAYNYFDSSDKAAVTARIDTVLAGYSVGFTPEADTTVISTENRDKYGVYGMSFALENTPKMRIYFTNDAYADSFTFFREGVQLNATLGDSLVYHDGKVLSYYEVDLFAYQVYGAITIKSGATEVGVLHMQKYLDNSAVTSDADLSALMVGLAKYSQAAKVYRDTVNSL